ncbi:hypothetical protein EVAR_50940_1 [Eumeta japonica]|uniref:Uncharacterized protein n=1 Tax=Eumeta variegata TaxID=151549 RepID=A0A4C1X9Y3_EUMVA|nr:hypothetical protein EVAR_50940_1 [Eumeta japonica]
MVTAAHGGLQPQRRRQERVVEWHQLADFGIFPVFRFREIGKRKQTTWPCGPFFLDRTVHCTRHRIAAASMPECTARRGVRRPSDQAKRWRGYLKHDARKRSAMRPVSAAGA